MKKLLVLPFLFLLLGVDCEPDQRFCRQHCTQVLAPLASKGVVVNGSQGLDGLGKKCHCYVELPVPLNPEVGK